MRLCLIFSVMFSFFIVEAIEVSGDQSGFWSSADNPYEMVGEISVPAGETLEIEAGVEVIALGNYKITAYGTILASGIEGDTIRFHGNGGLNWGGMRFEDEVNQSELHFCRISNTDDTNDYGIHSINSPILVHNCYIDDHQKGVSFSGLASVNPSYMEIKHTKISNVQKSGITVVDNSNVLIDSCEVTQCGLGTQFYGAIQLSLQTSEHNCSPVISNNHIHHNGKQGITMANMFNYNYMNPTITGNLVEYNLTGMYFYSAQGMVDNNVIRHNFIPGNINSGAGVMLYGAAGNGTFTNNEIYGNFTGFYLTAGATANIGNVYNGSDLDDGYNYIHDNIDESENVNSIYNDSSAEVLAQNNLWDSADPAEIAETITDVNDDGSLGEVIFEPLYWYTTPPAPENLTCEGVIPDQVELSWDFEDVLGFTHFNIYYSEADAGFELAGTSEAAEYLFGPTLPESYYEFYVTASNVFDIESDSSEVVEFTWISSEEDEIPSGNIAMKVYPNPFNPSTTIEFLTTEGMENIKLEIFNIKGQKIKMINLNCHPEFIEGSVHNPASSPSFFDSSLYSVTARQTAQDDKLRTVSGNRWMTQAGSRYMATWDGRDDNGSNVPSGIYFARLKAGDEIVVQKMMLMK